MDDGAIPFSRSVMTDLPVWCDLAREVEQLLGAPMAENEEWSARLKRHIDLHEPSPIELEQLLAVA